MVTSCSDFLHPHQLTCLKSSHSLFSLHLPPDNLTLPFLFIDLSLPSTSLPQNKHGKFWTQQRTDDRDSTQRKPGLGIKIWVEQKKIQPNKRD